ncbi:Transglutaminase-like superfamily protein [Enhydrobacter aerosaccus]|uniref:Transglutaminase-like superfamily protein n=1 Tax=Enhydrobacter aerosaccus TaxID=225324 RepID=A0A1T4TG28_9HYPH|nr:transglutaminase domain-containing protein [Enhydrobacter aerosaccus]SKA39241.1 Transglutaminase-like superfamily protein [Enhydrobacter aerosaccus]
MSLDFYRQPVDLSDPGTLGALFDSISSGPAACAKVVQGLLMHEHVAPAYGLALTDSQHAQAHIRSVSAMLESIVEHDPRPLTEARAVSARQIGVCRHFTLLHVAMLRRQGLPARARCGFGAYFQPGKFIDHWVTEYWNAPEKRWAMVDSQMDSVQRELFKLAFDPLDIPKGEFLVAGEAWARCRSGQADPANFGVLDMYGLWFIASNVIRDLAALNNREMLPWDGWGAMTPDDARIDLAFIDRLAALSREPDAHFAELRAIYRDDRRVAVPSVVFNHVLNRPEAA